MSNRNKIPSLTPTAHLWVASGIGFVTFLLFILIWQSVIVHFLPNGWNKTAAMMISFLVTVPIPVFIFDATIPAKCPKCGGEMFGSSFSPPYKECKKCSYRYEYTIFGKDRFCQRN